MAPQSEITRLIVEWSDGDQSAFNRLAPHVYDELRQMAGRVFRHGRPDSTLQPTALVHEAYLRLDGANLDVRHRSHFLALLAKTMRHVLVDHARKRGRQKRGGDQVAVTFHEELASGSEDLDTVIDVHDAIAKLAELDSRRAKALEMHYFGGLTYADIAAALDVSAATVDRELRLAKAWLLRELNRTTASS